MRPWSRTLPPVLAALVGLAATPARADGAPPEAVQMPEREAEQLRLFFGEEMVVTPSRGAEEERVLASANVYVVDREEIRHHGWRTLSEVLQSVPGLYVIDDLVFPSVGVRGVSSGFLAGTRIVKVMINGTPVNFRPTLTAFIGPEYIPIEAVERVEIAKGPLSALYGANAFLATVNVITRTPAPNLAAEVGGRVTVINQPGYGGSWLVSYGNANRSLLAAVTIDRIDRSGIGLMRTFPAQLDSPIFQRRSEGDISAPISAFLQLRLASQRLGTLVVDAGAQKLDTLGEFQLNSILTHNSRIVLVNLWSNASYEKHWSKFGVHGSIGYSQGIPDQDYRLWLTGSSFSYFHPNFDYWSLLGTTAFEYSPLGDRLSLKLGLDVEYTVEKILYYTQIYNQQAGTIVYGQSVNLLNTGVSPTQPYFDVGVYLQASSVPFKRWPGLHLTGNLRVDKSAFGPVAFPVEYSWRAAIAYRWKPNLVTKLIAGRAFQTPPGVLLFARPGFGNANYVIGNTTLPSSAMLRPQIVTSVEAIVSAKLFRYLAFDVGAYFQNLENEIQFIQSASAFVAINRGVRRSIGAEASARFSYRWFSAYGNLSVQDGFTNGRFDESTPLYPNVFGLLGVDGHFPRAYLHANVQLRVVGERGASQSNVFVNEAIPYTLPPYAQLDMTLSSVGVHLFGARSDTRIFASCRNVNGEEHFEPGFAGFDIPTLGRTFSFELRQAF